MTAEIFHCEQGTDEWRMLRLGIPTASEFSTVLAKGEGKMRKAYLRKLAGEVITGELTESYSNAHMERGHTMEPEARQFYAFLKDCEPQQVGFIKSGRKGCSPDALIGADGALEIKSCMPHILIEIIEGDKFPASYVAQCQGVLWVAEKEWIDLVVYWPKMPPFLKRAYRDEEYIKTLSSEIDRFNEELDALVEKIKLYGNPQEIAA